MKTGRRGEPAHLHASLSQDLQSHSTPCWHSTASRSTQTARPATMCVGSCCHPLRGAYSARVSGKPLPCPVQICTSAAHKCTGSRMCTSQALRQGKAGIRCNLQLWVCAMLDSRVPDLPCCTALPQKRCGCAPHMSRTALAPGSHRAPAGMTR